MEDKAVLFDHCLLFSLKKCSNRPDGREGPLVPYVKWHFPSAVDQAFLFSICEFCFPDAVKFALDQNRTSLKVETFSFVLTEGSGKRRWGYCRRTMIADTKAGGEARLPVCFCLLSFMPCFSIFKSILDEVISLAENCSPEALRSVHTFLETLIKQALPPPGASLSVPLPNGCKGKSQFILERPDDCDSLLDHVNFVPMLELIDPKNILALFISLLLERRIILVAKSLSVLSCTVQALVALLYPFTWQHIFIPILPASLLSFCCAPMPFFVGILRNSLPELQHLSNAGMMEREVIVFDIDNDKYLSEFSNQDLELMPSKFLSPLLASVTHYSKFVRSEKTLRQKLIALKKMRGGEENSEKTRDKTEENKTVKELSHAFINLMVSLTSSYRRFIVFEAESGVDRFQRQPFFDSQPPELRPYLELLAKTQMFEVFVRERAITKKLNSGEFERRVTALEKSTGKAAASRFTLYERGIITREDILKSEAELQERLRQEQDTSYFSALRKRGARGILLRGAHKKKSEDDTTPATPEFIMRSRRRSLEGMPLEMPLTARDRQRSLTLQELSMLVPVSALITPDTHATPQPSLHRKHNSNHVISTTSHNNNNNNTQPEESAPGTPIITSSPWSAPNTLRRARNRGVTQRKRHASLNGSDLGQFQPNLNLCTKEVSSWSAKDVLVWLSCLEGLPRESTTIINIIFSRINSSTGVDGPTLLTLRPEDLRAYGALTPLSSSTPPAAGCGVTEQDLTILFSSIAALKKREAEKNKLPTQV